MIVATTSRAKDHEIEFVRAFVRAERRDRLLRLRERKSGRQKFLLSLNNTTILDEQFAQRLTLQGRQNVPSILTRMGSPPEVYCISEDERFDQRFLRLETAFRDSQQVDFLIISCVPGRLAFARIEATNGQFILERKSAAR